MNVAFPVRDGYFRYLDHTPEDEARWKEFVVDLVHVALKEERPYRNTNYQHIDIAKWKLLRTKDQLRVYRPRSATVAQGHKDSAQCVLATGTIEGTLEDVLYGIHHVTTQDMRVTTSFLSADALDSAVLHIFENGTDDDPLRSFAVKWRIIEMPAGGLVRNRDGCVLEYMGIDVDHSGQRYAFHITETFDHPVCPPFNPQCAIRAKAHIRTIYRQVSPGRVGVYFLGDYSLSGKIPGLIARMSTAEIAVSVGKSVECAEAKKLTTLALTSSPVLNASRRTAISTRNANECTICRTCPGLMTMRTMGMCQLCGTSACSKCRSRKYLLSDEKKIAVSCCKQCIVAAKNLPVDPRLPLRVVSAALWRSQSMFAGDDRQWERECQSVELSLSSRSRGCFSSDGSWPHSVRSRKASELSSRRGWPHDSSVDSDQLTVGTVASQSSMDSIDSSHRNNDMRTLAWASSPSGVAHGGASTQSTPRPMQAAEGQAQMWIQMNELRLAAEQTYLLTQHNNKLVSEAAGLH